MVVNLNTFHSNISSNRWRSSLMHAPAALVFIAPASCMLLCTFVSCMLQTDGWGHTRQGRLHQTGRRWGGGARRYTIWGCFIPCEFTRGVSKTIIAVPEAYALNGEAPSNEEHAVGCGCLHACADCIAVAPVSKKKLTLMENSR
jgi:hypothetical protein